MLTGIATVTSLVVAGPTAAMKTLSLATTIKNVKNRKKSRPRPEMKYDTLVVAIFPVLK